MQSNISAFKRFNISVFFHFIGRLLYRTFVPIILLDNGYSLNQIFIYLIGYSLITVIFSISSVKIFSKKNILLFYIFAIISEILLIILLVPEKISYVMFGLIILVEGIYYSYYYISYNSLLSYYSSKEDTSNNLGILGITGKFSNIFAPIIGALLLMWNKGLFVVIAISFLIISILPLLKISKKDINGLNLSKIPLSKIKFELFSCSIRSGIEFIVFVMWSIFIYVSGYSLLYIGLIPAIEALTNIIIIYIIKKKLLSIKFRDLIKYVTLASIIIVSIYRFNYPEQVILTNFLISLAFTGFSLCVNADYFEKIKNYQTYYSSMLLESFGFLSWAVIGVVSLIVGLKYSILIPVILSIIWLFVNKLNINFD